MSETREIPHASEVTNQDLPSTNNEENPPVLTEEEKAQKEAIRTELVRKCRDYVQRYVENKSPGKIRYRALVKKRNNSYVFRYSPPSARGTPTTYFSQVVINRDTDECRFEYMRPKNHDRNLWYFPIWYMMNGFTKNASRTFQALNLEPVETSLTAVFEKLGYRVNYFGSARIGRVVCVEWDTLDQESTTENS